MRKLFTFATVFIAYARFHRLAYAARIAYGIAFKSIPF